MHIDVYINRSPAESGHPNLPSRSLSFCRPQCVRVGGKCGQAPEGGGAAEGAEEPAEAAGRLQRPAKGHVQGPSDAEHRLQPTSTRYPTVAL